MAIQIQFPCLASTTRTVDISEEDMAALYDIAVEQFLNILPHLDLDKRTLSFMPERAAIAGLAEKYGVIPTHAPSVEAFYRAALGKPNE